MDEALSADQYRRDLLDRIAQRISRKWELKVNARAVLDDEAQRAFIKIRRVKYVYPDYCELVTPPKQEDYELHEDGSVKGLTTARKAELLLLGHFKWQGWLLAKSHPYGWVAISPADYCAPQPLPRRHPDYFDEIEGLANYTDPFRSCKGRQVLSYLVAANEHGLDVGKSQEIVHANGNPYDNSAGNLIIKNIGRPMLCKECRKETTAELSRLIKVGGSRCRFCFICLQRIMNEQKRVRGR